MKKGVRQKIAGVVVNQRLNVPRVTFDQLKATLTNCVRHGPESQNREGHPHFRLQLEGKVSFVELINPGKGMRLRRLLHQIPWPAEPFR